MKATAIVQARMGSTRLPGKVMLTLQDKTMLGHVITRLQRSRCLDEILVATSDLTRDLSIVEEAKRYNVQVFAGSEQNVLERYVQAARAFPTDLIVRITSDCPLIDPGIIDEMVEQFTGEASAFDYMSNTLMRSFPRGLDVEIFTTQALEAAYLLATHADEREHVTPYLYQHPEQFRLGMYANPIDYSAYRWTLDTVQDWRFIQEVYRHLYPYNPSFSWKDVLALLAQKPELAKINADVQQKEA
ncbi:UNVERIFIED_CONTAM: spore coat polysaccharide biosynthesis protein SpsF [Brevibacillus sp. OAP136]